ncbi:hypothetical protein D3C81_1471900 [compost metagenome]
MPLFDQVLDRQGGSRLVVQQDLIDVRVAELAVEHHDFMPEIGVFEQFLAGERRIQNNRPVHHALRQQTMGLLAATNDHVVPLLVEHFFDALQ